MEQARSVYNAMTGLSFSKGKGLVEKVTGVEVDATPLGSPILATAARFSSSVVHAFNIGSLVRQVEKETGQAPDALLTGPQRRGQSYVTAAVQFYKIVQTFPNGRPSPFAEELRLMHSVQAAQAY